MLRAEIICNQSVEDDLIELIEENLPHLQYTKLSAIMGVGGHSKKLGNTVWPELNFCIFAYVNQEEAEKLKNIIKLVKEQFPNEGISIFFSQGVEL